MNLSKDQIDTLRTAIALLYKSKKGFNCFIARQLYMKFNVFKEDNKILNS